MRKELLELTKELISLKTDSGNTSELDKGLELLRSIISIFTIEEFESNGVKSMLVHNRAQGTRNFKIILNGHIDVLPGKPDQYEAKVDGDRLYGVGSMDMKAGVTCLITAFKEVANKVKYPLALQIVTDEQSGGVNGTKYQVENGIRGDFIIAGEPTNLDIVNKAKGVLWVKVSNTGKTAHSAYPWNGDNSLLNLVDFINKIRKKYPNPNSKEWVTTFNVSKMLTKNRTFNKIPDNGELWLDFRYPPEYSGLLDEIKSMLPNNLNLEIIENDPPLYVSPDNKYIQKMQEIGKGILNKKIKTYGAQGTSDSRFYTQVGCEGVEFGPIGGGIGTDKEWVSISSLEKYFMILEKFLLQLESS